MSNVNKQEAVSANYKTQDNLVARANFHQKYDKNLKWAHWDFNKYHFFPNCKILELGCGNGRIWDGQIDNLPFGVEITLTDFSQGMVEVTKERFSMYSNVTVKQMNIQNIEFHEDSFDVIIANSMLYHVPDIDKAVSEVFRVLKSDGLFYCTTFGENGQQKFFRDIFRKFNQEINVYEENSYPFIVQNGYGILRKKFENIIRYDYIDSLEVTDAKDITDYVLSTVKMSAFPKEKTVGLTEYFETLKDKNGIIHVPREYCTFISQKHE